MKWSSWIGALVIAAGLCHPSCGFEWLDRLIGIDLDNSQGQGFGAYYSDYASYTPGYFLPTDTFGYVPYTVGYPAQAGNGYSAAVPSWSWAPQTSYGAVYPAAPSTVSQPSCSCGN